MCDREARFEAEAPEDVRYDWWPPDLSIETCAGEIVEITCSMQSAMDSRSAEALRYHSVRDLSREASLALGRGVAARSAAYVQHGGVRIHYRFDDDRHYLCVVDTATSERGVMAIIQPEDAPAFEAFFAAVLCDCEEE